MRSVITGATGFVGGNLLELLLRRHDEILAVVLPGSVDKLRALGQRLGAGDDHLIAVTGDLTLPALGVGDADVERLAGADHFFHVAAVYDLTADAAATGAANIDGTRHARREPTSRSPLWGRP